MALKSKRILIVEDDVDSRSLLLDILEPYQFQIDAVESITDAKTKLDTTETLDFVFLDINLPDGSGLSLIETINKVKSKPIIVLITAVPSQDNIHTAIKQGVNKFISKPYTAKEVQEVLQTV